MHAFLVNRRSVGMRGTADYNEINECNEIVSKGD